MPNIMLANQAQYFFSIHEHLSSIISYSWMKRVLDPPEWKKKIKLLNETISSTNNDTFEYLPAGAFLPISSAIYVFQELVSHDQ